MESEGRRFVREVEAPLHWLVGLQRTGLKPGAAHKDYEPASWWAECPESNSVVVEQVEKGVHSARSVGEEKEVHSARGVEVEVEKMDLNVSRCEVV